MPTETPMGMSLLYQLHDALLGYGSLWTAIATMVLSIAVPLLIIIGKQAVKHIRAETFLRLEASFLKPNTDDTLDPQEALMDPTFDSVRCKYLESPVAEVDAEGRPRWSGFDRMFGWLTPTILYGFSVVVFGIIVAFIVDRLFVSGWLMVGPGCGESLNKCLPLSAQMMLLGLREPSAAFAADFAYAHNTAVMLGFAFTGAYLWCVLYLIRRVNNYDLTPYSFLLCGMRILLAVAIALTVRHTIFTNASLVTEAGGAIAGETGFATYLAVLVAFLLGFYPAAGLDYLVKRGQEFTIKRPHPDAAALRHTLPLDMIDGLTDFVRFRLEELEYEDVQNLATANPVLLYVETPYNILADHRLDRPGPAHHRGRPEEGAGAAQAQRAHHLRPRADRRQQPFPPLRPADPGRAGAVPRRARHHLGRRGPVDVRLHVHQHCRRPPRHPPGAGVERLLCRLPEGRPTRRRDPRPAQQAQPGGRLDEHAGRAVRRADRSHQRPRSRADFAALLLQQRVQQNERDQGFSSSCRAS